jgi:hypothetical protein
MRSGVVAFLAVLLVGLAALLVTGLARGSSLVYTLGVAPQGPVAKLEPGGRACQGAVNLPGDARFERIGLYPRAPGGPGPRLDVVIRPADGGAALARGEVPAGYRNGTPPALRYADLGEQRRPEPFTVCVTNRGSQAVELWGTGSLASPSTSSVLDGKPGDFDLGVTFAEGDERSLLALLPEAAERASVFHPAFASPLLYAVLAALVLLGGPGLLVVALRRCL